MGGYSRRLERVGQSARRRRGLQPPAKQSRCAVAGALRIVGDRWTLVIIRDLLRGRTRFADLAAAPEGITRSVLSDRLKSLEVEGIIERRFYSEHPPRADYRLTRKGRALGPAVAALARWGARYLEHDSVFISATCGHELSLSFECPVCQRKVPPSEARITELEPRLNT